MATEYLPFNDKLAAKQQSAEWWVRILGHPKHPEDISEFVCQILSHPTIPSRNYAVLTDQVKADVFPVLTSQEMNFVNANKVPESNQQVQETLEANKPPHPP